MSLWFAYTEIQKGVHTLGICVHPPVPPSVIRFFFVLFLKPKTIAGTRVYFVVVTP